MQGSASALLADPSDYLVSADGTIEAQAAETLGHYADWLELRTQELRDRERLHFSTAASHRRTGAVEVC